jgi:hypothetical protein
MPLSLAKHMYKSAALTVAILFIYNIGKSQSHTLSTWGVLNTEIHFHKKCTAFFETQIRSANFFKDFNYHELKVGGQYTPSDKWSMLAGVGQFTTYNTSGDFDSPVVHEFRVWEQLTLNNKLGRVKIDHRYRVEQRYISKDEINRFRYRLNVAVPINNKDVTNNTLYAVANDEIFFTNTAPYFQRNRLYGGAGFTFNKYCAVQVGLMRQFDMRKDETTSYKDFLQATLYLDVFTQHGHPNNNNSSSD